MAREPALVFDMRSDSDNEHHLSQMQIVVLAVPDDFYIHLCVLSQVRLLTRMRAERTCFHVRAACTQYGAASLNQGPTASHEACAESDNAADLATGWAMP